MGNRLVWADILRILVIYFVILVHVTTLPKTLTTSSLLVIAQFAIAKTCVPIFFMLSGALLLSRKESPINFLKSRFKRLIRPYVFWTSVFILLLILVSSHTSIPDLISDVKTGLRVFWFFPIIICLYLITPAIRIYVSNATHKQIAYMLLIWFLFVSFLPFFRNTQAFPIRTSTDILNLTINFSGYFLLGYYLTIVDSLKSRIGSLLLILIGVLWTVISTIQLPLTDTSVNLTFFEYISPSIVVLSIGVFNLFQSLNGYFDSKTNEKQKKLIEDVSVLVFGVYLLHTVTIQIFERVHIGLPHTQLPHVFDYLLSSLFVFTITLLVVYILSGMKFLRKFVS